MGGSQGRTRAPGHMGVAPGAAAAASRPARVTVAEIEAEFAAQDEPVPENVVARRTLARLATGIVGRSAGTPGIPQELLREQILANVVFAYVRPPDPRDVHARMMPQLIRSALQAKQAPVPNRTIVDTLAQTAVGFLRESDNPHGATGKIIAASTVVDFYLAGA